MMNNRTIGLVSAYAWSAILHVAIVLFLFLSTLSCQHYERVFAFLHLPEQWNPITCEEPLSLRGPVIQATLVGETSMALPQPPDAVDIVDDTPEPSTPPEPEPEDVDVPPEPQTVEPPEEVADMPAMPEVDVDEPTPPDTPEPVTPDTPDVTEDEPDVEPVDTLPAPPEEPDVKDQEEVVDEAENDDAEVAEEAQEAKQKERMSELDAEQQERQKKIDELLEQLDMAGADSDAQHAESESIAKELEDSKQDEPADSGAQSRAEETKTGNNGQDTDAYKAAVQNAVTRAWLRPDSIRAGATCKVHIRQIPGGEVVEVTVDSSCPLDTLGKRSVQNAVLRAQPLPYKGFEDVFERNLTLNFKIED